MVRANLLFAMRMRKVEGQPGRCHMQVRLTSLRTSSAARCPSSPVCAACRPVQRRQSLPVPLVCFLYQMVNWLDLGRDTVPPWLANTITERW